jgi:prepilin-type N-terminal cleavage/methylation domain-containing protein
LVLTAMRKHPSPAPTELVVMAGRKSSRGFSLVELMIAMVVLAVGLLAAAGLIGAAMAGNVAPKLGSTSATLAESTMERILAVPPDATGTAALTTLTDCAGNNFIVNTLVGGSPLDFKQPALPGYAMQYVTCAAGQNMTYDVRWMIEPGPTPSTQLITVSARVLPGNAAPPGASAPTMTLRTLRGGS